MGEKDTSKATPFPLIANSTQKRSLPKFLTHKCMFKELALGFFFYLPNYQTYLLKIGDYFFFICLIILLPYLEFSHAVTEALGIEFQYPKSRLFDFTFKIYKSFQVHARVAKNVLQGTSSINNPSRGNTSHVKIDFMQQYSVSFAGEPYTSANKEFRFS